MQNEKNEIASTITKEQKEEIENELVLFEKTPSFDLILDNIYVGNYAFALNKDLLIKNKINYILNCGNGLKNFYEKENIFKYLYLPLYDSENEKIIKYKDKIKNFIKEGSSLNNKILIHCGAGMSRSVSILLLYMITELNYLYSDAYHLVKQKRKCALPNMGFRKQLEQISYEIHKKF